MRSWLCAPLLAGVLAALPRPAAADDGVEKGSLGLGLIIGEPTGIAGKLYLQDDQAIQAALGFTFVTGGFHAHADYVFHPWILEEREAFTLPAYVGPGVRVLQHRAGRGADDDFRIGARAVAGLLFDFKEIPLDVFVEVAGIVEVRFGSSDPAINGLGLALNGGLGARYYF
ncbi:MAG: hypothetical protein R3B06_24240 [Kofleriaceae bacterium]